MQAEVSNKSSNLTSVLYTQLGGIINLARIETPPDFERCTSPCDEVPPDFERCTLPCDEPCGRPRALHFTLRRSAP
jgi:hypothetical protein